MIFNAISAAEMAALPKELQLDLLSEFHLLPEDLDNLDTSRFGKVQRIISYHNLKKTPAELEEYVHEMEDLHADVVKFATMADSFEDASKVVALALQAKVPAVGLAMGDLGFFGILIPEEYGGLGLGAFEYCLVAEELGRAIAPGPVIDTALIARAVASIEPTVSAALAEGRARASLGVQGAVSATRDGDTLVLDGRASAVQAAGSVDWLLVRVDGPDGPALVLLETAEVNPERRRTMDETRGWYDVAFAAVRVPAGRVLPRTGPQVQALLDAASFSLYSAE